MATGLSYETDIAPLKQQYFQKVFGDSRLNPNAAAMLSSQFSGQLNQTYAGQQEIRDKDSVAKLREQQYASTKLTLEREKEKAQRERSMLTELMPLQQQLLGVSNDNSLSSDQKLKVYGQIGVQNAGLFAVNPAASTAYNAAIQSITKDTKPQLTLGNYINSGGDVKYLKGFLDSRKGQPVDENTPIPALEIAGALGSSKRDITERDSLNKELRAQRKKQQEGETALLNDAKAAGFFKTETGTIDESKFDKPMSEAAVKFVIDSYGTAEERKSATGKSAKDLISLAQPIIMQTLSGARTKANTDVAATVRGGFTSKPQ